MPTADDVKKLNLKRGAGLANRISNIPRSPADLITKVGSNLVGKAVEAIPSSPRRPGWIDTSQGSNTQVNFASVSEAKYGFPREVKPPLLEEGCDECKDTTLPEVTINLSNFRIINGRTVKGQVNKIGEKGNIHSIKWVVHTCVRGTRAYGYVPSTINKNQISVTFPERPPSRHSGISFNFYFFVIYCDRNGELRRGKGIIGNTINFIEPGLHVELPMDYRASVTVGESTPYYMFAEGEINSKVPWKANYEKDERALGKPKTP